jgi:hypothetical protein
MMYAKKSMQIIQQQQKNNANGTCCDTRIGTDNNTLVVDDRHDCCLFMDARAW